MATITERALNIPPFIVMDVLEKAHELEKEGEHIIHLEIHRIVLHPDHFVISELAPSGEEYLVIEEYVVRDHRLGWVEDRDYSYDIIRFIGVEVEYGCEPQGQALKIADPVTVLK